MKLVVFFGVAAGAALLLCGLVAREPGAALAGALVAGVSAAAGFAAHRLDVMGGR